MVGPTPRIIIAIDFGTTCSSIGYMYTNTPQPEGKVIKEWPGAYESSEWAPTTIKYNDPDPYQWGYQIEQHEHRHEWFKLGLSPDLQKSGLAKRYPSRTALPPVSGAECEKLVTDYLRGLKTHAGEYLKEKFGEVVMKNNPPHYIITVPAVWSERAQAKTRLCAENAGMGNRYHIQIITEPEAAGIYALKNMKLPLKKDDTFVLCDAGGGTVDLISYTVREVGDQPVIYESATGSGDLCGSTFLNRMFDQYLREKFQYFPQWDNDYHQDAMRRFETRIKREYNGDPKKKFTVPARGLPDNSLLGIQNGQVEISGKTLGKIFDQVISVILDLVTAQIRDTEKTVTAVLLAGGFGQSKYLEERVKKAVGSVKVVRIEDGETSIVRGALIRGLAEKSPGIPGSINVDGRVARRYIGTPAWVPYDSRIHYKSNPEHDPLKGGHRVEVMEWLIRKRSMVRESDPILHPFYWDRKVDDGRPTIIEVTLYKCDDPQNTGASIYPDDPGVQKLVKLNADLTKIPESRFKQESDKFGGVMYYKVPFFIEMTFKSGSLKFTFIHNEKRYDTVDQVFD